MDSNDIRWNFEKFLIGKDGIPVKRYDPFTMPPEIDADIKALIDAQTIRPGRMTYLYLYVLYILY